NDAWWGKGFTEWTNVGRAKPLFPGHNQPRVPADLGYYDLRLPETRAAQAALAREHGIHGFCYYHYWFNGRRLLERPFNEVLNSGSPDFPFCLCWANENWTRAWDGLEREVLIKQHYGPDDDLAHIRWLANAFRDPRYIHVHGKPLFLVYRVASLPDPMQTVSIWREEARRLGIGELFLCSVESRVGGSQSVNPARIGFDAAVEFQPDGLHFPKPVKTLNDYGGIFDYRSVVTQMLQKPEADYLRFPCLAPGWDNSARRKENPTIITGSTPELYGQWLDGILQRRSEAKPEENIVFINAWNEWGEGAYLEPDQLSGRAYLEMTKQVLARHTSATVIINSENSVQPALEIGAGKKQVTATAASVGDAPLLSVCMPIYNGNKFLEEAIRSVLDQTFKDFELVIVDDCSTEDPAPILSRFKDPRIQFHRNAVRQGLVGNWNRCVELSRGQLVCVFHQDDVMLPENLRRKVEVLKQNPGAALAYSDARVVEEDLSVRHPGWFTPTLPDEDKLFAGREFFEKMVLGDNLVCCPSAMFRRAAFEQLGKFDSQLPYTADWEMWLRLALQFDVAYIKEPLLLYRVHDRNETHRFKGLKELEQGYRAKMTALKRSAGNLPDAEAITARVAGETARKALAEMRNRGHVRTVKDLRAWLQFAAEAQRASLAQPTYEAASDWFLRALDDCAAPLSGGAQEEEGWSEAEEQQFAQARQFEIEGKADRALPLLERLAAVKPASARVWFQLGRAQTGLGQSAAAEKSWSVVIAQKPKDWLKTFHAYAMRGSACEKQGRKVDALADFARGAQLALYEGCPDLACEMDQLMGLLLNGGNSQRRTSPTKEQLRTYALTSRLLDTVGRDIGRPGPISTFEFERANTVWEQFLAESATPKSLTPLLEGFEAVTAGLAKQHLERAVERADATLQRRIITAWTALTETAKPGTIPEAIVEAVQRQAPALESNDPDASIIIPTFNRLDMTRRCLESLARQRGKLNVEIIVVDNASTDGTIDFLKSEVEAGRLRAIVNPENRGFSKACNQGARAAAGRHLLFLNNDTDVQPGWLEPLVETLDVDERVSAVGSKLLFPDRSIQHAGVAVLEDRQLPDPLVARHIHYRKPENAPEVNQPQTLQALTAACLLIRKAAFEKVGGFDEEYWNGYEDVDLCFKLRQEGGLLVYQPRSVVLHYESQSGPERFRQVAHNTKRLHETWLGKITPDFVVAADGIISQTASVVIAPYAAKPVKRDAAPVASIIILAHNQLEHTRLCLDSIR
ncbi:MAG TPA: glycoside hydrolase family 99-like domain-containing protein, partial [Verrucomicrobiae bacterium]|nr:glycoside hydrolase family 99-like domain-containing protein [Verrucomicrobiae bacterium]